MTKNLIGKVMTIFLVILFSAYCVSVAEESKRARRMPTPRAPSVTIEGTVLDMQITANTGLGHTLYILKIGESDEEFNLIRVSQSEFYSTKVGGYIVVDCYHSEDNSYSTCYIFQ